MLALKSKLSLTALFAGLVIASSAFGQQMPSQRYQPVRDSAAHQLPAAQKAPPSVHVPGQGMRQLQPSFRPPANAAPAPNYNFSDTGQQSLRTNRGQTNRPSLNPAVRPTTGVIQQTSYQVDQYGELPVPAILRGAPTQQRVMPLVQPSAIQPVQTQPIVDKVTRKTPADFANSIGQIRGTTPRIAPNELATQQQSISEQMAELRRRSEEKAKLVADQEAQAQALAAKIETERLETERLETERLQKEQLEAIRFEQQQLAAAQAEAQRQDAARQEAIRVEAERMATERIAKLEAERMEAERLAAQQVEALRLENQKLAAERVQRERLAQLAEANRLEMEKREAARLAAIEKAEAVRLASMQQSATEFIGMDTQEPKQEPAQIVAKRITSIEPANMDNQVRQVSSEVAAPEATISLAAPALQVETFGPQTVGLNKPATYQVVVKNNSGSLADRILVGINLPQWVDIENVNLTSGGKEITDGENQARLVWSIDKIPGNSSQTITVTAVPRKPEAFDIGVEWTLVPRVGKSSVAVTEPKLEMTISGPQEVLYGETAMYHVICRNPGTGTAENVVVMLPEALGGARATLGNIAAGKEQDFEVELLARTAGDMNLVATAAADQNLKVSAERALIVRRGNLDVTLTGPGLKYAGSGAQYDITVTNKGDATAQDVVTAVALPPGVKYLSGIESVKLIEGGLRWKVGNLEPGQTRKFKVNCELNTSGDLQIEVGARAKGELAASSACLTSVETVADLVLTVADPKGPLPTGEKVPYTIKVVNRGSKAAKGVNLVMQFSEGIEPLKATGLEYRLVPGQVLFTPISQIDPGQEMSFKVTAEALKSGTHIFRAQLTCQDSDAREIAEGTTRFFGEKIKRAPVASTATAPETTTDSNEFSLQR